MKVLVWVDMEGPSGIDDYHMLRSGQEVYARACAFATHDVNAAVRGIRRVGPAATIDVFDGHGSGRNLLVDEIEPGCTYLGGGWMTTFLDMVRSERVRAYDAVLLLGQHAAGGTADGFMSHTNTSYTAMQVNGRAAGEAPQIAWLFGHFGVPVVLVAGDDAVAREAGALLPGIETVAVKTALDKGRADCLPVDEAHRRIEDAAAAVLSDLPHRGPYTVSRPVTMEIFYTAEQMAVTATQLWGMQRTGTCSVSYVADDYLEAWYAYNTCRLVSALHNANELLGRLTDLPGAQPRIDALAEERTRRWLGGSQPLPPVKY